MLRIVENPADQIKEALMRSTHLRGNSLKVIPGLPPNLLPVIGGAVLAALFLLSCKPDSGFNTVSDYDLVATFYAQDAVFDTLNTYAIPDTVMHFRDPDDTSSDDISREFDGLLLDLVRTNFEALGYEEEADPGSNPPDVFVVVWVTTAEWLQNSSEDWWDMWGWYPHWPPAWGPGWVTLYPHPVEYFYRPGSVFIDMIDDVEIEEGEDPYILVLWAASVNGILIDTSEGARQRLTDNINQAFDQSPYLATGE
jgi:hypothetical protein